MCLEFTKCDMEAVDDIKIRHLRHLGYKTWSFV